MVVWNKIKRILGSKFVVFLALILVWLVGSSSIQENSAKADDYSLGAVYQRYLLGSKADYLAQEGASKDIMIVGSIGSGGVAGEFSYDDIVNGAEPSNNQDDAKKFASMMATYSTFGYFGNKVQGFESLGSYFVRGVLGTLLIIPALVIDILQMIVPSIIGLIAKLNVITYLADAITNLKVTSDLTDQLGVSKETIAGLANALMTFALVVILITVLLMIRKGSSNIDQRYASKLKGRLITLIFLPLIIGGCATILMEASDWISSDDLNSGGGFSRYLVDVRSWAYNYNFAPAGNSSADGGIIPTNKSSYVDLSFDPYTGKGGDRIAQINSNSSILGDNGNLFKNSALVLSYLSSESFTATDYINYKGTSASEHFYGREDGDGETFGSYYRYAINNKSQLADVKNAYNSSFKGGKRDVKDAQGSYLAAIDDYATKDGQLIVSPQQAYRDRFIYGAKTSGDNLDKYYGTKPSLEMVTGEVGTANGSAITDQSMFLVLSTIFGETGGRYYLDSPARGILQEKAKFDSNRSSYYVVNMVGNPIFSFLGLIAIPLITIVVWAGVILAAMSMGIVEMNVLPLSAYFKGLTLGDIEYVQALAVYTIGIAGTILMLIGIPSLTIKFLGLAANLIKIPSILVGFTPQTPQSSLGYNGTTLLIQSVVAVLFGVLFIKNDSFREKFILLYTIPWSWAKASAERFLQSAGGVVSNRMSQYQKEAIEKNPFHSSLKEYHQMNDKDNSNSEEDSENNQPVVKKTLQKFVGGELGALKKAYSNTKLANISQLRKTPGKFDVAETSLTENELDKDLTEQTRLDSQKAKKELLAMKQNPTKGNVKNVKESLENLRNQMVEENADPKKIKRIEDAIDNVNSIYDSKGKESNNKENQSKDKQSNNNQEPDSTDKEKNSSHEGNKQKEIDQLKVGNGTDKTDEPDKTAKTSHESGSKKSSPKVSKNSQKFDDTKINKSGENSSKEKIPTNTTNKSLENKVSPSDIIRNQKSNDIKTGSTQYDNNNGTEINGIDRNISKQTDMDDSTNESTTTNQREINVPLDTNESGKNNSVISKRTEYHKMTPIQNKNLPKKTTESKKVIEKENRNMKRPITTKETLKTFEKYVTNKDVIEENQIKNLETTKVLHRTQVNYQEYSNLVRSLGKNAKVPEISNTLKKLQTSGTREDIKKASLELTKQIDKLKPKERRNIDGKKLVKTLTNMIK